MQLENLFVYSKVSSEASQMRLR